MNVPFITYFWRLYYVVKKMSISKFEKIKFVISISKLTDIKNLAYNHIVCKNFNQEYS